MSASNEKSARKTLASQKEEQKKKKEKIKWTVIGVLIVIFFAFVIYLNTGAFYRNLTGITVEYGASEELGIEAGSRSFTVAECNYVYNMQYMNLLNSYGDYASLIGLDKSQPLDQQKCTMAGDKGDDYTWDDYFMDNTKTFLEQLVALEAYAKANDITLDKDDNKTIDEQMATFDDATQYGYASADKFIAANYGRGCNSAVVRDVMELQQLATKAQQSVANSYSFTASELAKKYDSVKDDYDKFTYDFYLVAAETVTGEDGKAAAPTNEALSKAMKTANSIKDSMDKDKLSLEKAVQKAVKGAKLTNKDAIPGSDAESDLKEWLVSAKRKKGDVTVIKGSTGAYIVQFQSRNNNKEKTDESGDMNLCDYIAQNLLRGDALQKWQEEKLGVVTKDAKATTSFGAMYIGR